MDDILGVVEHHRRRRSPGRDLERDQPIVEMVEAIGLRGRPITIDLHRFDAVIGDGLDGCCGGRIVAVIAGKDPVIVIVEPADGCPEHRRDHRRFVPGRHEHDEEAGLGIGGEIARERPRIPRIDGQRTPPSPRKINRVNENVAERKEKKSRARKECQFGRDATEHLR